jgi:hypothetical protein
MTKGKHWTTQEEAELKTLVKANAKMDEIASKLQKSPGAIILKCQRLGLNLQSKGYVNAAVLLPRDLLSAEEGLKMLAGAFKTAIQPGLDKLEVQRLQAVANIAKTYKEYLSDYINYREIENKLKEMEQLNARLLKESGSNASSESDTAKMA